MISIPVDPTLTFSMVCACALTLIVLGVRIGTANSRLTALEKSDETKAQMIDVLSQALTTTRLDIQGKYAPIEYMRSIETKIDNQGTTMSEMNATMAAQGATLAAIQESLRVQPPR